MKRRKDPPITVVVRYQDLPDWVDRYLEALYVLVPELREEVQTKTQAEESA